MMDWIDNLWNWLQTNDNFTSWTTAIVSVLTIIGIPTIVSMAKTLSNAKENRSYRTVTLVRVLWMVGFIASMMAYIAQSLIEDKAYNDSLSKAKRISDLKTVCADRNKVLEKRQAKVDSMSKVAKAKVDEYDKVPISRKRK